MTASRSSAPALAMTLAVMLAVAGPAPAQDVLVPASPPPTSPAAGPSTPAGPDPTAPIRLGPRRSVIPVPARPAVAPDAPPGADGPSVNVETLETVDADSVGTLNAEDGGLGVDMWQGSDRALVARLIALLPQRLGSPTMRDLVRRLLLTRAAAPAPAPAAAPAPGLFGLRVAALAATGDRADALALIGVAPPGTVDEQLLWTAAEARFYGFDTAGACRIVQGEAQDQKSAYWEQATAFCLALGGKIAEAQLLADVLQERTEGVPNAFFAAIEALSGARPPPVESLKQPTGLHLALLRSARLPVPADALSGASPAALAALAAHAQLPIELRLQAAERAAGLGVMSGRALFEIYGDAGFGAEDFEGALEKAAGQWGPRGRALLIRAAARYDVPAARAEVLQQAFRLAHARGGFRTVSIAARPLLESMKPAVELRWFAGDALRALLSTGDPAAALPWLALAENAGTSAPEEEKAKLWPLARLARAGGAAVAPDALTAWWRAQDPADPGATARGQVLFALLDAGGVAVPPGLWGLVLDRARDDGAAVPSIAVRNGLIRAAADRRRGETVALALLALGETGPAASNMVAVELAVRALRAIGLEPEAHALALEAAVAAGL